MSSYAARVTVAVLSAAFALTASANRVAEQVVSTRASLNGLSAAGDVLLYMDDMSFYRLQLDGSAPAVINGQAVRAISADGEVLCGREPQTLIACYWNEPLVVANYITQDAYSYPEACSSDGGVIAGQTYAVNGSTPYAFRWTAADGVELLTSTISGAACGVSADGDVIVGVLGDTSLECSGGQISAGPQQAWLWTDGQSTGLGYLPNGTKSRAMGVSADGLVAYGYSISNYTQAFRWTAAGGMQSLNGIQAHMIAYDATADGSVIVGMSWIGDDRDLFWWDATGGARPLYDVLCQEYGLADELALYSVALPVTDFDLKPVTISDDGATIAFLGGRVASSSGAMQTVVLVAQLSEPFSIGDMNCDGALNAFDIDPFVTALVDPSYYAARYPDCSHALADINEDGAVNAFDIDPFVQALVGG